jgi:hypothetical protein
MSMEDYNFAKAREAWPTPVKIVQYKCKCGRTMKFESEQGVIAPQRTWVGLKDEEVFEICNSSYNRDTELVKMVEAELKQKNGYAEEKNT